MDSIGLIRHFLQDRLGVEASRVRPDTVLGEIGVDSLMLLELMFEFEDRFGIKLSQDIKSPGTVGGLADLMDGLIGGPKA
ncbi:MAG: acyl carrier protein [Zoogloeaceae bacterium]|nr:acyl carrier protein [Zoogloeaceae bacterium]